MPRKTPPAWDPNGDLEKKLAEILGAPALRVVKAPKSENWSKNYAEYEKSTDPDKVPCVFCGKPLNGKSARYWLHDIGGGGGLYLHPGDEHLYVTDGADMGTYPIGEDCLRRRPELKPFTTRKT